MSSDLAAELLAKHKNSAQTSSQTLCAVLSATLEVLQSQGLEPSPAALFAAVMSSLEKPEGSEPVEICLALCTVLNACLGRIPDSVVRSRFVDCSKLILKVLKLHEQQAGIMRAAVESLGHITSAMDPNSWAPAVEPFARLLALSFDTRPKVRKAAQQALTNVFAAIVDQPVWSNACESVRQVCLQVLPGPEAALLMAQGKKSSKQQTNSVVHKATSDALHCLNLLRLILPLLNGTTAGQIAEMLPKLFSVKHSILSRQAADTLAALCASSSAKLSPKQLSGLLTQICLAESIWQSRDADVQVSLMKLLEEGYLRLHALDAQLALSEVDDGVTRLFPLLSAPQDGTRLAARMVFRNLIQAYVQNASLKELKHMKRVFKALEQGLDLAHQDTLISVLPVVEELFSCLDVSCVTLVVDIVDAVGSICGMQADEEVMGEADEEVHAILKAAQAAMGAAIRNLGPKAVLTILPLRIQAKEGENSNLWMLPLLRQHVSATTMDFWGSAMLPVARALIENASGLGSSQQMEVVQLRALELQIWSLLPSFCIWPKDVDTAFRAHAQTLGNAFQNRHDLQGPICSALIRLCTQARVAAQSGDDGHGFPLPSANADDEDDDLHLEELSSTPSHYTPEVAQRDLKVLRSFAKNWMPLLFNAFVEAKPGYRSHLAGATAAYASIAEPSIMEAFFKTIVKKLIKAIGDKDQEKDIQASLAGTEQRCTFMELALCLAPGLPTQAIQVLYKIASPATQEKDQAIQKRAYRLLAYILEERQDYAHAHMQEVLDNLLLGVATSMSAAKRYRLRCLKAAILMLQAADAPSVSVSDDEMSSMTDAEKKRQVISVLIAEIILCIKEVNKKTRVAAYELLVSLARTMHENDPPPTILGEDTSMGEEAEDGQQQHRGGLNDLFNMVLAGLIGATPHMISASVMALARLLYEFSAHLQVAAPQLLPVVLSLLRSKAREIIKSVLGFVKVCVMRLPVEVLQEHLGLILEGILLWSEDSKNKFRLKVRIIIQRLVGKLDYESVAEHIPEGERKLLTHIRKENEKKSKRGQSELGSEADVEDEATVAGRSRAGKTNKIRSEWGHSRVFSSDDEEEGNANHGARRFSGAKSVASNKTKKGQKGKMGVRFANSDDDDPIDLADPAHSRTMHKAAAGQVRPDPEASFPMDGARMVINEEAAPKLKLKRKRGGGIDTAASDDSDFDDLHHIRGATAALRISGASAAASMAGMSGAKSGAKSSGGKTFGGKTSAAVSLGKKSVQSSKHGKEHSGKRFAASKRGAGGDVKGRSKVEPYAYWPLDRKMLNRRTSKQAEASKGLASTVRPGGGPARGHKAKKQKR